MVSHLARSIDPRYPTVRVGLGLATLGGAARIAVELQQGSGLVDALGMAFNLGTAAFLAWAIGRELDPDDPAGAALAGAITIPIAWLAGPSGLAATAALLVLARLVVRTVGPAPTTVDQIGLVGLAALASATGAGWVAAMGLAFGTARDVRLPGSTSRLQLVTSLAVAVAATVRRLLAGPGVGAEWTLPLLTFAALALLAGATLRLNRLPTTVTDLTGELLHPLRIQSGRRHVVVTAALAAMFAGAPAAVALTPALAALLSTRLRQRRHDSVE